MAEKDATLLTLDTTGEQLQVLRFRAGGEQPEPFPRFSKDAKKTKEQRYNATKRTARLAAAVEAER